MPTYEITGPNGKKYRVTGQGSKEEAMAQVRRQVEGGGGAPQQEEPSIMQRIMSSMSESGKNVREAVMNPMQSIPDALRTTSDFISLGQTDRLRAGLKGTDYEAEKAETNAASGRLGSIDEAINLGAAFLQPSSAAKYAGIVGGRGIVPAIKKAVAYGAENAALSGLEASIKGEPMLPAMGAGGVFGAGGSIAGDAVGSVANIFGGKGGPKYKTDEDFFADADSMNRSTAKGREMNRKKGRLEQAREAKPEGRSAFKQIQSDQKRTNRAELGINRAEREALANVAHTPNLKKIKTDARGDILKGGTFFGGIPIATATAGLAPMAGAFLKGRARAMPDLDPLSYERYASSIRNAGEPNSPAFVDNETIDAWREALAKMSAGSQRGPR